MTSLRIKVLLPMLFCLLVLLGLGQGGLAIFEIARMSDQVEEIALGRLPRAEAVGTMRLAHAEIRRIYAAAMAAGTEADLSGVIDSLHKARAARDESYKAFEALITLPATKALYDSLASKTQTYRDTGAQMVELLTTGKSEEARALYSGAMRDAALAVDAAMVEISDANRALAKDALLEAENVESSARSWTMMVAAFSTIVAVGAAIVSVLRVAQPITNITVAMKDLADGEMTKTVPYGSRHDEIGNMAAAVEVFRQNAIDRVKLEREAAENRSLSETDRLAREEQKAREAAEVQFAVDQLADGLAQLSNGNLAIRLNSAFTDHLDALRGNFNSSVAKLQSALQAVNDSARNIDAGAKEILSAANDLSKRTEQQAASVEETAAALEEVTTAVKDSAVRANESGDLVSRTKAGAEKSGEIVNEAIGAMTEIEKSSGEIANIIGVIDEIAFQTNLLALNAGVEAARAGEAGKGFAVVAQEVRELAQRSAKAAKEIKALINTSGDHVRNGVNLVSRTGEALNEIVRQVQQINGNVGAIVTSAREQSTGLQEINLAVNQMDQGTQQNAAMVEQSTAASHALAQQAASLSSLLAQFELGEQKRAPIAAAPESRPTASPARALGRKLASAFNGSAALNPPAEWSEF